MMKNYVKIIRDTEKVLCSYLADVPFLQIEDIQVAPASNDRHPDLTAKLRLPSGDITLVIEAKFNGQPRIAREAISQIERMTRDIPYAYGVFVAPYISPVAAEICIQRNIGYMDLAGNCRFSFWPVYIKTMREKNPFVQRRELRSLYSPKSIKTLTILRVLLENPRRVWRTQELAANAGTSLGQVASVKKQLEDREWINATSAGFRLTDPSALLWEWSENYDIRRNRIRDFYTLKSLPEIEAELAEFCENAGISYALTGFSGGARYAPAVRYQRATAYAADDDVAKVAHALNLKEVSSGANVSLIVLDDRNVLYGSQLIGGVCVASPGQVYLDLRSLHARGEEAAEALLRGVIEPKWQ